MLAIKLVILVALIKLLQATNQPLLCSGLYALVVFVFGLAWGGSFLAVLIGSVIAFGLASLYFWLLDTTEGSGLLIGLV